MKKNRTLNLIGIFMCWLSAESFTFANSNNAEAGGGGNTAIVTAPTVPVQAPAPTVNNSANVTAVVSVQPVDGGTNAASGTGLSVQGVSPSDNGRSTNRGAQKNRSRSNRQ